MKIKARFVKQSYKDILGSFVIIIGLLFVGCGLGWEQYNEVKDLQTSKQWPITTGVVTESDIYSRKSYGAYDSGETVAAVSYSYTVGVESYSGDLYSRAFVFTSKQKRLINKYPQGSQITVYYHPEKPDLSIVEPGLNISALMMVASLLMLGLGIRFLIEEFIFVFKIGRSELYVSNYSEQELANLEAYLGKRIDVDKNVSEITKPKE